MVLGCDAAAAGPRGAPLRNVLRKGRRALNRRLVHLRVLPDVVHRPVALHRADLGALRRALAVRRVLGNVVLHERVARPAVHRDQHRARRPRRRAVKRNGSAVLVVT